LPRFAGQGKKYSLLGATFKTKIVMSTSGGRRKKMSIPRTGWRDGPGGSWQFVTFRGGSWQFLAVCGGSQWFEAVRFV